MDAHKNPVLAIGGAEPAFEHIVGVSNGLQEVLTKVKIVAPTSAHVLIIGESGTGKELIARTIHRISPRAHGSFVKVNCAAIPAGLLESELFGQERSTAANEKMGRLELADKGTLVLYEFGDLPLPLHTRFLRMIAEHKLQRSGSTNDIEVNARLIAITNRELAKGMAEASFQRDLYYKLHVFPIRLPALRERKEDIPFLVRHFVQMFARKANKQIDNIPAETMDALTKWHWPGNVGELETFIERSVAETQGPVLNAPVDELRS